MTINKSQGQSMKYMGVDLQSRQCFTYGQLYVGLSRVTKKQNLHLITPMTDPRNPIRYMLDNPVYKQVLLKRNQV